MFTRWIRRTGRSAQASTDADCRRRLEKRAQMDAELRAAGEFLFGVRPLHVRGVEEVDAEVERPQPHRYRRRVVYCTSTASAPTAALAPTTSHGGSRQRINAISATSASANSHSPRMASTPTGR